MIAQMGGGIGECRQRKQPNPLLGLQMRRSSLRDTCHSQSRLSPVFGVPRIMDASSVHPAIIMSKAVVVVQKQLTQPLSGDSTRGDKAD